MYVCVYACVYVVRHAHAVEVALDALLFVLVDKLHASREEALGHSAVANSLSNLILSSRRAARSVSAPPPRAPPHPQLADAATVSADAVAERFSRLSLRSRSRTSAGNTTVRSSTFGRSSSPPTRSSQDQLSPARRLQNPRYGGAAEGASQH